RVRPTRGTSISVTGEVAGLGGSVKYGRMRGKAATYFNVGSGFVFSLTAEGGWIAPYGDSDTAFGGDDVLLTDRFFLGEGQIRGFDIRGIGPRIIRLEQGQTLDDVLAGDRNTGRDDALGGRAFYLGRAELEIPLGSGARELGLRPSVFLDVGALFGLDTPAIQSFPNGVANRDSDGNALFTEQVAGVDADGNPTTTAVTTVNPIAADGVTANAAQLLLPAFREVFLGNTPTPRIAVGVGVNWNSPFGPFRIDFAHILKSVRGDEEKRFSFNVGTQF
ncbi:MAG: BamA/TamA family outer membrane protein, partial [Erythrobacter sp.]